MNYAAVEGGGNALSRLHPVTKLLVLLLGFISAFLVEHPLWLCGLAVVYGLASARTGVFPLLRRMAWLLALVAFASFAIWSLSSRGHSVVWTLGPFRVTREGMLFGAGMGVRLDLMIFCGLIFLSVTPLEEFIYGLNRLGMPFPVAFALSLSFRLIPLFLDSLRAIQEAQWARGFQPAGSPLRRLRDSLFLLDPVLMCALRRADQLAMALESRGFGVSRKRGSLRRYGVRGADVWAMAVMFLIIAVLLFLRSRGLGMTGAK